MKIINTEIRKVAAEFIGTFGLVFAGCGAIISDAASNGSVTHVGISICFGLAVCMMVYATGHISGAHFNPAVTIAFAASKRFPWREVPAYILSQSAAAIAAISVLSAATGTQVVGETVPSVGHTEAVVLEAVMTFFLMFVISAVATDHRAVGDMAGLAIGAAVAACALFGGPMTGASMNPARSLGPAIFSGDLAVMWIYVVGPICGAVAAALTYGWLRCDSDPGADASGCC